MIHNRNKTVYHSLTRYNYGYLVGLIAFLAFLILLLFTIVEMRRAIIFPISFYYKIGSPSTILYTSPYHFALLIAAGLGIGLSYKYLSRQEGRASAAGIDLKSLTAFLAIAIMAFLIVDLFIYRGVPAERIASSGKLGVGQVFNVKSFPFWLQPFLSATNYLALVWHATLLGIFIGALFLAFLGQRLKKIIGEKGFLSHLSGSALALPQPFCSCCAAPIGASLYRTGISLGPILAFVVSSPMLNITSLILALTLLPANFALLRIAGGIVLGVFMTYAVSKIVSRWEAGPKASQKPEKLAKKSLGIIDWYGKLFQFGNIAADEAAKSPTTFLSSWLRMAWRLGRVAVPVLFLGAVLTEAIIMLLPSPGNNMLGILLASAVGTILMIPTWTEIPVTGTLLGQGLYGPAAAVLLTLPATSIPCLLIVSSSTSTRAAILLGFFTFIAGLLSGIAFL